MGIADSCEVRVPEWVEDNEQVMAMVKKTRNAICTRWDYPYKEEEDFCFPPLDNEYEEPWPDSEFNLKKQRRRYIWMKAPGEEWDDWYDMRKPAFDTDYDLSDCAWMLAEEGVLENLWSGCRYLDWQFPLYGRSRGAYIPHRVSKFWIHPS